MRRFLFSYGASLLLALSSITAWAHPGHSHARDDSAPALRRWIDLTTGDEWQAVYVASKAGQVQLRQHDGRLVHVPIERLTQADRAWLARREGEMRLTNERPFLLAAADMTIEGNDDGCQGGATSTNDPAAALTQAFEPFAKLKAINYRNDKNYFYVESNGMPDHPMMIGISAWQQQVPLPQKYTGENAWQIPLHPVPAIEPAMAKNRFLRGAIALAVNGIPIFNPLNNRGDDAYLFGELDEYGGHCGRADDYHYHIAPVHLEKIIGKGKPIAYALDGYPIYGYDEADGTRVTQLDKLNGHKDSAGHYHYHATKTYPYLNGGFYGKVVERDGQVDPQPRAQPVREFLPPLQGAKIVDFKSSKPNNYVLTYDVKGRKGTVSYTVNADGSAAFSFIDPSGKTTNENYTPRRRAPGGKEGPPPRKPGETPPPRKGNEPPPRPEANAENAKPNSATSAGTLIVSSSAIGANARIAAEHTCDGDGVSPPVSWSGAPAGTKCYALSLWHTAPDQEKSYWLVYNIPASTTQFVRNAKSLGTFGLNDRRRAAYEPMCSKGPGVKKYHITVYALSSEVQLSGNQANRANLLAAIKGNILAEGTLTFEYQRPSQN